ncbi:MAG TPA: ABC transporter ATP-binding protein [Thermomicrobiaceae bacterium]|nr:ABC transporter ATP-binding protein [Thermomicrobiaceae bacterium]
MNILRRILGYLKPYVGHMVVGYLSLVLAIGMQLLTPRLVEYVIDDGLVSPNRHVVEVGALAIVGAGIVQGVFTYLRSYIFQFLAERVSFDVRNDLYRKMQGLSFGYFDRANTGQLMSRATEDVNSIRRFLMQSLRSIVQTLGILAVITFILVRTDLTLAVISLSVMPLLLATAIGFGHTIRPRFLKVQQQFGVMTTDLQENLAGARVVRAFAREGEESQKFDNTLARLYDVEMATVRQYAFFFPLMTLLSSLGIALTLWYGGEQVVRGNLTLGQLTAFYLYLSMLADPIRMLGWVVNSTARALASGERIFEVLDTRPEIQTPSQPAPVSSLTGEVEFQHVSFRYPSAIEQALSDISFSATPGERIALIGGTGSGKSSITALIPRFYDVSAGAVLIDGHDVRTLALDMLRANVGMVLQDTFLFSVTIGENIAYGRPSATRDEIIAAAKAARIHEFIATLPQGYDTVVGERGVSLSGGQKQRIAIARALVMNPRILVLDDATSSVDTQTEYEIQQALHELMRGRTTFVIAHRLLTLKGADQILVLDGGRIIERGTHESLLAAGGHYARIYELQLREQEEFAAAAD